MNASTDHKEKMQRVKASVDRRIEAAQEERGILIVFTGAGKGKTTAALGMVMRCLGHGMKVAIVQFIKGAIDTAEQRALREFGDLVTFLRLGEGYTWETQDRERDTKVAGEAWEKAVEFLRNPNYAMVVLDELNIAMKYDYVDVAEVLTVIRNRPVMQHVVITGRGAKPELLEAADLVSEMKMVKHPFRKGIKAQKGVEF
ncbi:MAG: cob(I)yrinic acid a,c-diamide adenosyltransferase [Nitrospira sp. SB0677_bin_15]|nr:cob(I)yrinic acid a,c-diamide adenosyltransferase [Nitrospira sp. SB0667_bin_9]MYD31169.1 cob(I)yrinic acid a,c-diamide adenosyltransferase [Nitrospira sp. SB0661_bin_20]MYG39378.1 cob(I)yrinic acid a,c-diamide adenosyltransferase [Nitrospira sp. SB0677_bin_15]MYH03124.1 cob(I)yrinic acid a,c-diamide adenosyltransferase [Nitrospira sp. SB0675_bin_23]MYJ23214.1 cob(I)yrinic acid a,c-diamide adenosyltransferase [Nitrospira sp. SB0673_bin_12]